MVAISKEEKTEEQQEEQGEKGKVKGAAKVFDIIFTVFIYLLSAAILVGAFLFSFSTTPDKSLFGIRYYTILTPSMTPTYEVGDMIFVKVCGPDEINVGDVITFNPSQDSDAYLTHRVFEKLDNYQGTGVTCFRTKGDANGSEDSFLIDSDRVIGTVSFGIPKLGYAVRFLQMRWYLILPIVIMVVVFLYLLKRYFSMGKDDEEGEEEEAPKPEPESKAQDPEVPENPEPTAESGNEKPEKDGTEEPEKEKKT